MEERIEVGVEEKQSIYKTVRKIKRRENSLYNALRSIYEDSIFVNEISQLWPSLPLLANLRCGLWYSPWFHSTCYFKSTDGHTNNLSFSTSRLNLHVAILAGRKGGCIIVDSTRKGKSFPYSMSKTIPIWTCVLNRAVARNRSLLDHSDGSAMERNGDDLVQGVGTDETDTLPEWDCSLHLPLWVSDTERAKIEGRLDDWTNELEASGADIALAGLYLRKPLRPLWISQRTVIWLNEVPDHQSWDFTPIILLSSSCSSGLAQLKMMSEFSWNYIPGAGDDEESWARGFTPPLFWKHAHDIIDSGPEVCNRKIAEIVEENRVYRAQRGYDAPQIKAKASKLADLGVNMSHEDCSHSPGTLNVETDFASGDEACSITWLDSTNLSVGKAQSSGAKESGVSSILNCSQEHISSLVENQDDYLHLPMMNSKYNRSSILGSLTAKEPSTTKGEDDPVDGEGYNNGSIKRAKLQLTLEALLQDPILTDLPKNPTLSDVNTFISLELGSAMRISILKLDSSNFDVAVMNTATVKDLKMAVKKKVVDLEQSQMGHRQISWKHVWANFCLSYHNQKLLDDSSRLQDHHGIRNNSQVAYTERSL